MEKSLNSPTRWDDPIPLTAETIKEVGTVNKKLYDHNDVYNALNEADYGDFGWKNDSANHIPKISWHLVYSNDTGSFCIYVNHPNKVYYSVDMGD